MILNENNQLKLNIASIQQDLNKYKGYTKTRLFQECIHEKLKYTVQMYNEEIDLNTDFLLSKESARVLKAITKIQKADDKNLLDSLDLNEENNEEDEENE